VAAAEHALEIAHIAAQAAFDKKAENIALLDVSEHLVITDLFLICSASNERQVKAIVDGIEEELLKSGVKAIRREGHREGRWVLLDYFEMVVHVQQNEERSLYDLERLWADCPHLPLELV
jgi:ribosome-associated protein